MTTRPFSHEMVLTPISRRPLELLPETARAVVTAPYPAGTVAYEAIGAGISIVVLTRDQLVLTRLCLESLLAHADVDDEVIVVDNASTDGTPDYLCEMTRRFPQVRVLLNKTNRGFAAANNQALTAAHGEAFVLLNNDTIVPPGSIERLVGYLQDPTIGLVGPVTNRIGNEAEIETDYRTYGELLRFAEQHAGLHRGECFEVPSLCMFCLAMRRGVYEHLGPLDERYEVGMLEDDDYSMHARAAGYRVVCAEDVFIHHFGEGSFGGLFASGEYGRLIEANRRRFEEKWGVPWRPYDRRPGGRYRQTRDKVREAIAAVASPGTAVLVVSKGDEEMLRISGVRAGHFPQNEHGQYAGCYPADSAAAIVHLEDLRACGAEFLAFPQTAFWWLTHYAGFREHLDSRHRRVWDDAFTVIYQLLTSAPVESAVERQP